MKQLSICMIKKYYTLLVTLLLLACGGSDTPELNTRSISESNPSDPDLVGTWEGSCSGFDDSGDSLRTTWVFYESGRVDQISEQWSSNTTCSGDASIRNVLGGIYKVGTTYQLSSGGEAMGLDVLHDLGHDTFDIYQINGDQTVLYLGGETTGNGRSESTRPTELNFSEPFTKLQ